MALRVRGRGRRRRVVIAVVDAGELTTDANFRSDAGDDVAEKVEGAMTARADPLIIPPGVDAAVSVGTGCALTTLSNSSSSMTSAAVSPETPLDIAVVCASSSSVRNVTSSSSLNTDLKDGDGVAFFTPVVVVIIVVDESG